MQHFENRQQISAEEYCEMLGKWLGDAKQYADDRPISIEGMSANHEEVQEWFDWFVTYYKVDMWVSFDKPYYVVGDTVNATLNIHNRTDRPIKDAALSQTTATAGYPKLFADQKTNINANGSQSFNGSFAATASLIGTLSAGATLTFGASNSFSSNIATTRIEAVNYAYDLAITITSKPADGTAYVIGETITWDVTITNTGNVPLTNAKLTSDLSGVTFADGGAIAEITVGASKTLRATYTVKDSDTGKSITNKVNAASNGVTKSVTAQSVAVHTYKITVKVDITNTGTGINSAYTTGDDIVYTITIENDSDIALNDVDITSSISSLE